MTMQKFQRVSEGDRWVALRKIDAKPVSAPLISPDTPAEEKLESFGLLKQIHLRHDAMSGTRHT